MGSFNATLLAALLSAGVSPDRAREVVEQFDRAIDERFGLHVQVLATKRDLAELQVALTDRIGESSQRIAALEGSTAARIAALDGSTAARIAALEGSTATRIAELDGSTAARIAELDGRLSSRIAELDGRLSSRIAETKADLVKWMLGALTAQTALILGAFKFL